MGHKLLPVGTVIDGRYKLHGLIGVGGMGTVYRCTMLDRPEEVIALKMLHTTDEGDIIRLKNEMAALFSINHPNVVQPFDSFREGAHIGFTMEYVRGGDLRDLLQVEGRLEWEEAAHLLEQIAIGLTAVHDGDVIHRDLKPENILLPARNMVRVSDFGTALSLRGRRTTASGSLLGSVYYMSPEYIRSNTIDERSDIYALGVLGFEMLTGDVPFPGETLDEVLNAKVLREAPSVYDKDVEVPTMLADIIACALRKNPNRRFQTARDFANSLRALNMVGDSGARIPAIRVSSAAVRAERQ